MTDPILKKIKLYTKWQWTLLTSLLITSHHVIEMIKESWTQQITIYTTCCNAIYGAYKSLKTWEEHILGYAQKCRRIYLCIPHGNGVKDVQFTSRITTYITNASHSSVSGAGAVLMTMSVVLLIVTSVQIWQALLHPEITLSMQARNFSIYIYCCFLERNGSLSLKIFNVLFPVIKK